METFSKLLQYQNGKGCLHMTQTTHEETLLKDPKPYFQKISAELRIAEHQVAATAKLLDEGATIPFIARYRKEATGTLDEVQIAEIRDRLDQIAELEKRRAAIAKSLSERELLTEELQHKIEAAETLAVLEDIYLPFRPKRKTRASAAREKGLEPLAERIFAQGDGDPLAEAAAFVDPEKGVATLEEALAGARDIIAEWVNENEKARARMRDFFSQKAIFQSRVIEGKESEGNRYRDYFNWEEIAAKAPSHRILAMRRGEKEGFLTLRVVPPEEEAILLLKAMFVTGEGPASKQVSLAVEDCYRRLLCASMETEIRMVAKKRADAEAIRVFAKNLRQLLLAPPLGQKTILAIDPGFRTGCKIVCLDAQGKLLHSDVILPHHSEGLRKASAEAVRSLCRRFRIEAFAVGNGTAGRETETFLRELNLPGEIQIFMVNESGASIYSASKIAREEFPNEDVTVRGAVSIGRRLADPLAELVKIDPKAIGVGQYQHDVDQAELKRSLDETVMSCVNAVGVELNTASAALLGYVSGFGPALAANIVSWRDEHGPFLSRQALMDVPRLGAKAFVQAAGFLRIRDGENPLDASAVHPESYFIVEKMAESLNCSVKDLIGDESLQNKIDLNHYVTADIGLPTLNDILSELAKPGRDPRTQLEEFHFADGIEKIEDLAPGMKLPGIVTNLTAFGAFVDIGVHQDGLIHTSQLAERFVKDPAEVLKVSQIIEVTVIAVDLERKRISLTLKKNSSAPAGRKPSERKTNDAATGRKPSERKTNDGAGAGEPFGKRTENAGRRDEKKPRPHFAPDKRTDKRPQREKRDEKVPFNNPFAALLGKKE
jgi:uncharacterized protein